MMGEDSLDDTSGDVMGVVTLDGEPSDAVLPEVMLSTLEFEDDLLRG